MITRINIRDYKGLHDFSFSPKNKNGYIYGENGCGKSCFADAVFFLLKTMRTLYDNSRIYSLPSRVQGIYPELESEDLIYRLSSSNESLSELLRRAKAVSSEAGPAFEIEFIRNKKRGKYAVSFTDDSVEKESLSFEYGDRMLTLFSLSADGVFLSPAAFTDNWYKKELQEKAERYFGRNTFMAVLYSELQSSSARYFRGRVSDELEASVDFLSSVSVISEEGIIATSVFRRADIASGYTDFLPEKDRKDIERMLNLYLPYVLPAYSRVYYQTYIAGFRECYELWFEKDGKSISVRNESKGIQKLVQLFPFFIASLIGETVVIDSTDSGVADRILIGIYNALDNDAEGQLFVTFSSEYIIKDLRKDNVYILETLNGKSSINAYSRESMEIKKLHSDKKILLEFREMFEGLGVK